MLAGGVGAQPGIQGELLRRFFFRAVAGGGDQGGFGAGQPGIAPGGGAEGAQAVGEGAFAEHGDQGEQAVGIGFGQGGGFGDAGAGFGREAHGGVGLGRPAIAGEAGEGDVQFCPGIGVARVAMEQPLGGVVGIGFGQAVGVFFRGDLLPVGEVERELSPALHS